LGLPGAIFKKFLLHKNIHSNKDYESWKANIKINFHKNIFK
jgi:hypothetical protein